MVSDPEAALQLATGPDGIAAGMGAGKGYVDASTIDAGTAQKIAEVSTHQLKSSCAPQNLLGTIQCSLWRRPCPAPGDLQLLRCWTPTMHQSCMRCCTIVRDHHYDPSQLHEVLQDWMRHSCMRCWTNMNPHSAAPR